MLDALDKSLYAENTIIVLWSDHGMYIGKKALGKIYTLGTIHSGSVDVIVSGTTQSQSICQLPVSLLDVYPTLVELRAN